MSEPTKPVDPAKPDPQTKIAQASTAEPLKPAFTEAEMTARVEAALAEERRKAKEASDAEKAERDKKKAEEEGRFKDIATKAEQERDALKATVAARDRADAVRDALAKAAKPHKDAGYDVDVFARYLTPAITSALAADAKPADIDKAAKDAVEQYVTDNPRVARGSAGAPPVIRGGTRVPAGRQPNQRPFQPGVAGSRF